MPLRIAAPLLALIGHELRAPAGVVGGYLGLLERSKDDLTADQQKALAGARRAQQSLVEVLDDLRRLTALWQTDHDPLTWVALPHLLDLVRGEATSRGVPLTLDAGATIAVPCRGRDTALAAALVTVGEAIRREHETAVVATAVVEDHALVWRMRPAGGPPETGARRDDFELWRPGLGVRLVAAAVAIVASHGTLYDLRRGDERLGVDVSFDLGAAGPPADLV